MMFSIFKKRLPEAPADSLPVGSVVYGGIYIQKTTGQLVVVMSVTADKFADGCRETVVTFKALDNSSPYFRSMGAKFFLSDYLYDESWSQ